MQFQNRIESTIRQAEKQYKAAHELLERAKEKIEEMILSDVMNE